MGDNMRKRKRLGYSNNYKDDNNDNNIKLFDIEKNRIEHILDKYKIEKKIIIYNFNNTLKGCKWELSTNNYVCYKTLYNEINNIISDCFYLKQSNIQSINNNFYFEIIINKNQEKMDFINNNVYYLLKYLILILICIILLYIYYIYKK